MRSAEDLRQRLLSKISGLSVEGSLRNFSLPVLVSAFTGKRLDYDGAINGSPTAKGDLKAKGQLATRPMNGTNQSRNTRSAPSRQTRCK